MGRFSVEYVLLVPHIARKRRLVQAPGPGVTVVFLTFLALAQRGGVYCCVLSAPPPHRGVGGNRHLVPPPPPGGGGGTVIW